MKDLLIRIVVGFIVVFIVIAIFYITVDLIKEKQYQYLTFENEWGISSKCYIDENQYTLCFINNELVKVRQFYEYE